MMQRPATKVRPAASKRRDIHRLTAGIPLCLCLVAVLVLASVFLAYSHRVLGRALEGQQATLNEAEDVARRRDEAERHARQEAQAKRLLAQAGSEGLLRKEWNERRINIQSITMERARINALLAEVSNSPNQVFGAEQFEISVKDTSHGLFDTPSASDEGVVLSLKGVALFRSTQVQQ